MGSWEDKQTVSFTFKHLSSELRGDVAFGKLTFSCVEESEGPAATSTIILSPLCGEKAMGNVSVTQSNRDSIHLENI